MEFTNKISWSSSISRRNRNTSSDKKVGSRSKRQSDTTQAKRLEQLRSELKTFERDFLQQHNRKPTKADMENQPALKALLIEYLQLRKHKSDVPGPGKRKQRASDSDDSSADEALVPKPAQPSLPLEGLSRCSNDASDDSDCRRGGEGWWSAESCDSSSSSSSESPRAVASDSGDDQPRVSEVRVLRTRMRELLRASASTDLEAAVPVDQQLVGAGQQARHERAHVLEDHAPEPPPPPALREPEIRSTPVAAPKAHPSGSTPLVAPASRSVGSSANYRRLKLRHGYRGGGGGRRRWRGRGGMRDSASAGDDSELPGGAVAADALEALVAPAPPQLDIQETAVPRPPPASLSVSDEQLQVLLKTHTGLERLRLGQGETVRRLLAGHSTLLVSATGSGKSLVFWLATLARRTFGHSAARPLTLVVSPLVALIHDQLRALSARCPSLAAATLSGSQAAAEQERVAARLLAGELDVLMLAPEKLLAPSFARLRSAARFPPVGLCVVDEAHCVSEWSHTFRPAYLRVARVLRSLGAPVCGLTATATSRVAHDVAGQLGIAADGGVLRVGGAAPRHVRLTASLVPEAGARVRTLLAMRDWQRGPTIVYCALKRDCDELATALQERGVSAAAYHAGKGEAERARLAREFGADQLAVLCATVAFGMGVDKPNVAHVLHYSLPRSLEAYVQEVGRAARGGGSGHAHVLVCADDVERQVALAYGEQADETQLRRLIARVLMMERSDDGSAGRHARPRGSLVPLDVGRIERESDVPRALLAVLLELLESEGALALVPAASLPGTTHSADSAGDWPNGAWPLQCSLDATFARQLEHSLMQQALAVAVASPDGLVRVDVAALASGSGLSLPQLWAELVMLGRQRRGLLGDAARPGFLVQIQLPESVAAAEARVEQLMTDLPARVARLQRLRVAKLRFAHEVLSATASAESGVGDELHGQIDEYFADAKLDERLLGQLAEREAAEVASLSGAKALAARREVCAALRLHGEAVRTARALARLLAGVGGGEAGAWARGSPHWRRCAHVPFAALLTMAAEELARART